MEFSWLFKGLDGRICGYLCNKADTDSTKSLMIRIFQTPSLLKVFSKNIFNFEKSIQRFTRFTDEIMKECLLDNDAGIKIIANNPSFFVCIFDRFNQEIRELLISKIMKANKGRLLPSIEWGWGDKLEVFIDFNNTIKKQIITELLNNDDFSRLVTDVDKLDYLFKTYPERRIELIAKAKQYGLLKLTHNGYTFYKLLKSVPEEKEAIIKLLNSRNLDLSKCLRNCEDLRWIVYTLGHETMKVVIKAAGKLKGGLTKLIENTDRFEEFCNDNDELARSIISAQHKENESAFHFVAKRGYQYVMFLQLFPEHLSALRQVLLNKIINHDKGIKDYIDSISNLAVIISHFPDLQDELISLFFVDFKTTKYSTHYYSLLNATIQAPSSAVLIWSYIQASPGLYAMIITSPAQSFNVIKQMTMAEDTCHQNIGEQQVHKRKRLFLPVVSDHKLTQFRRELSTSRHVFNSNAAERSWVDTSRPETFIPPAFLELLSIKDQEPVFSTCTHASKSSIREILRDGILYPKKLSGVMGISNGNDVNRKDDELVFTSVNGPYRGDYFTFSIPMLCAINRYHNNSENVVFKFYDWSAFNSLVLHVTPEIEIRNFHGGAAHQSELDKVSKFCFYMKGKEEAVAVVEIPIEKMMYYGYNGLNNYLRYFIFLIISKLPEEHIDIRNAIYTSFNAMGIKALHHHLTTIARELLTSSELDFLGKVSLDHFMIKNVTINNHTADFDTLRDHIKKGNISELHEALSAESTYTLLSRSYFIVAGFVEFAELCSQPKIASFLRRTFHTTLELAGIQERKSALSNLPTEIIDNVYSLSSKPYQLDENDMECFNNLIAYRPNHV